MKRILLLIILSVTWIPPLAAQGFCGITNSAFEDGEWLKYKVYYNVSFMYIGAGEVTFTTRLVNFQGHPSWHVVGKGRTFSTYDLFFKVRDQYESYIDTASMLPLEFIRNVSEGSYTKYNKVSFNHGKHTAISRNGTYQILRCTQDVISAIYYARNIDFNRYNPGDKIPFTMFLDDELYHIYIRYVGKETVTTHYGKFHAIVFKPLLIKGTIFEGGEKMKVWVSDDRNRIPLRINSPITVGSIKVDLVGYQNLRNPFSALIEKN